MSSPGPVWDENFKRYRWLDPATNQWVWEDPALKGKAVAQDPTAPRGSAATLGFPQPGHRDSVSDPVYQLSSEVASLSVGGTTSAATPLDPSDANDPVQQHATKSLRGTDVGSAKLDDRFRQRAPGFFRVGKVIKVLWVENLGHAATRGMSVLEDARFEGEYFVSKVRWFVIIRDGKNWCSVLPIGTYGGQGVGKSGTTKNHHAIMYTGKKAPSPAKDELPKGREAGMRASIRVLPHVEGDRLDKMSRVNFAKIYTVEKNVKVYNFGQVDPKDEHLLVGHFRNIWNFDPVRTVTASLPQQASAGPTYGSQNAYTDLQGKSSAYNQPYGQQPSSSYGTSSTTNPYEYGASSTVYGSTMVQAQATPGYGHQYAGTYGSMPTYPSGYGGQATSSGQEYADPNPDYMHATRGAGAPGSPELPQSGYGSSNMPGYGRPIMAPRTSDTESTQVHIRGAGAPGSAGSPTSGYGASNMPGYGRPVTQTPSGYTSSSTGYGNTALYGYSPSRTGSGGQSTGSTYPASLSHPSQQRTTSYPYHTTHQYTQEEEDDDETSSEEEEPLSPPSSTRKR